MHHQDVWPLFSVNLVSNVPVVSPGLATRSLTDCLATSPARDSKLCFVSPRVFGGAGPRPFYWKSGCLMLILITEQNLENNQFIASFLCTYIEEKFHLHESHTFKTLNSGYSQAVPKYPQNTPKVNPVLASLYFTEYNNVVMIMK